LVEGILQSALISKGDLVLNKEVVNLYEIIQKQVEIATFKKTNGLDSLKYKVGERGAQIIILPYPQVFMTEVPELSNSERGEGGFGSTGK
jgi:dUTP pyrophosphatase